MQDENKRYNSNNESNFILWLIPGYCRFSNIFWFILLICVGTGFLITGLSSYFQISIFFNLPQINYIPQGIIMTFYGTLAITQSILILIGILFDVGGGFNRFDKEDGRIQIVRKGWPGKNKTILLTYTFDEIDKVEVFIREGLNPKRIIYLLNKDGRKIPLNPISQLMSLQEIEDRAFKLANFLKVDLFFNIKRNS
jgi:hypothetical protein